jgi:hypothetical protein
MRKIVLFTRATGALDKTATGACNKAPGMTTRAGALAFALLANGAFAQTTPALLQDYCVKCHNFEDWAGSLDIESLNYEHVEESAEVWEKIIRKVKSGMMPPAGEERPARMEMDAFAMQLEQRLDTSVASIPAAPALHRLNRNEYANAIRDIFNMKIDTTSLLPQDDASEGFDNIASGLGFSPALIQGYTSAAMKISRWVVGDMTTTESSKAYMAPADLAQDRHLEGMPLGTRGGLKIVHNFPLDAEYDFSVRGGFGRNPNTETVITLDGQEIQVSNLRSFRLPVTAGEHTLTVSIADVKRPTGVNDIYSVYSVAGAIDTVEIIGPFNATGPGQTASRERIFSCYPQTNDEERSCAESIAVDIATQAFREPVTIAELEPVMAFYEQGRQEGDFESGIQQALSRILLDPRFLFRFEEEPQALAAGEIYRISDLELATRLSFFLWSSIPDNELLDLAEQGRLSDSSVLRQQVLRMLEDPKAQALVENFAGQWLYLRELAGVTPEAAAFDENLRQAFVEETQLLVGNVISEDRPVTELLNADYTFLNERLAKHYGIDNIRGSYFRKVQLPQDSHRRGILGHGSILTVTSTASRTSPVIRGIWILENLLNAPVPAPPPGVETNLDGDGTTVLTTSIRERLEAHRADPVCSSCHSVIDPVGFALENYDSIGAWREYDGESAVDATGVLVDGTAVGSPADLREALMTRSELFVTTLTEKLLTYALSRGLEYHDMPTVRSIMRDAAATEYRFTALVMGIVQSPQFTQRVKSGDTGTAVAAAAAR